MTDAPWVLCAAVASAWLALWLWPSCTAGFERGTQVRALRRAGLRVQGAVTGWRSGGSRGAARRRERSLLAVVDALAPALESGLPAASALAQAADSASDHQMLELLREVAAGAAEGVPLGEALAERLQGAGWGNGGDVAGLELLSRAWRLADRMGTPMAATTRTVGAVIRAEIAARRATAAAVTEAKATVRVLIVLPLLGPLLAIAVGVSPTDLYGARAGAACGLLGIAMVAAGRAWMTRLVDNVATAPDPA